MNKQLLINSANLFVVTVLTAGFIASQKMPGPLVAAQCIITLLALCKFVIDLQMEIK